MEKAHDVEVQQHTDDGHPQPNLPLLIDTAYTTTHHLPDGEPHPAPERTIWQLYPLWQIFALWLLCFAGTWPIFFYTGWTLLEWYHGRPVRFNGDVPFWQSCLVYGVSCAGLDGCWSVVKGWMLRRGNV